MDHDLKLIIPDAGYVWIFFSDILKILKMFPFHVFSRILDLFDMELFSFFDILEILAVYLF